MPPTTQAPFYRWSWVDINIVPILPSLSNMHLSAYYILFLNCTIVALQCCVSFCCKQTESATHTQHPLPLISSHLEFPVPYNRFSLVIYFIHVLFLCVCGGTIIFYGPDVPLFI